MLRISHDRTTGHVRLEGQLVGPWVEELHRVCDGHAVVLDVRDVTFADEAGVALLRALQARQVKLTGCSPFLAEQLKE